MSVNQTGYRKSLASILAVVSLVVAACGGQQDAQTSESQLTSSASDAPVADGPHASNDRKLAERMVTENDAKTATIIDVDFGNVSSGDYSAPLRGVVVTPKNAQAPTPLVVVSHLRAPNCDDASFAYPCPDGASEYRFDRGMTYFGEKLAEQGYTVVIPDLGGVFVGTDVNDPYDQNAMWKEVIGKFVEVLRSDSTDGTNTLGAQFAQPVDLNNVGLVVHSRSGTVTTPAIELFGSDKVKSVFAYGPAYDTVDLEHITPAGDDVPYLALVGEADADVGASANLWIGHYLSEHRQHAASVVSVPGLGHMYINRAASEAKTDDRIGCDERDCPDAAEHERIFSTLAIDWLNATLRGMDTDLPLTSDKPLPAMVADVPARWLAHTPGETTSLGAEQFTAEGQKSQGLCVNPDPMSPVEIDNSCPMPEEGYVQIVTPVNYFTDAHVDVDIAGTHGIAVQVSPSGTYPGEGTPVTITLRLIGGQEFVHEIPATDPALINRSSEIDNGIYQLGTVRIPLPDWVADGVIEHIRITSGEHPIELRSIDFWR
ncbi:MAG: dienelactone hydrolase family protein [Corynebacterium sp.]|nr:dienelactone hydrolase family protein [Corynebacterium sp.]